MNIGARDTAMCNISNDCNLQPLKPSHTLSDCQRVEQRLSWMFMRAIAGIDDTSFCQSSDGVGSAR